MKGKFILAFVLALAFVVALGIGATPASAQTGCDCHTAVPPTNGAPAAHAPFVASVTDCTVCHKGMTVPHPTLVEPTLTVSGRVAGIGFAIRGGLSRPWLPLAGVVVYVQAKAPAAADYMDLGSPTKTDTFGFYRHGSLVTHAWTLRAISQGLTGPPVVMPALSAPSFDRPTPTLTLRLDGLTRGAVKLGHAVTAKGKVTPSDMAGQNVNLKVQKWMPASSRWKWVVLRVEGKTNILVVKRAISATGTYSWNYTPKQTGLYRVKAKIPNTSAYNDVLTDWRRFRVK